MATTASFWNFQLYPDDDITIFFGGGDEDETYSDQELNDNPFDEPENPFDNDLEESLFEDVEL